MAPIKILPSADYLHECFVLREDGTLVWTARPRSHFSSDAVWKCQHSRDAGKVVGGALQKGYLVVRLDDVLYLQHRVIWKMVTGEEPPTELDHENRSKSSNVPSNLLDSGRSLNCINKGVRADSHSGIKGVSLKRGRWRARIYVDGRNVHLGNFDDPAHAAAAHLSAGIEHYGLAAIPPEHRDRFAALVSDLATEDVRSGARAIPGFVIHETKKAI